MERKGERKKKRVVPGGVLGVSVGPGPTGASSPRGCSGCSCPWPSRHVGVWFSGGQGASGSPGVGVGAMVGWGVAGGNRCLRSPDPLGVAPGIVRHRGPQGATCHIFTCLATSRPQTSQDVKNHPKPPQPEPPEPPKPPKPPSRPPRHPLPIHPTTAAPSPTVGRHACARLCMRVHRRGGCEGCPPTCWVLLIGRGAVQNSPVAAGPTSPRRCTVYKGSEGRARAVGSFCWGLGLELQSRSAPYDPDLRTKETQRVYMSNI